MTSSLLRKAITAVKANQRVKARTLLRQLLVDEPDNEMAWIWLSEASDEFSEKVYALQQALEINPKRTAVQTQLAQLRANHKIKPIAIKEADPLAEAVALAANGNFQAARNALIKLANENQSQIETWLLLSLLVDNIEDKIIALENVLQLKPHHADAQKLLKRRLQGEGDKLTQGRLFEKKQDWKNAIMAYETAVIISPIENEKKIAISRLEALNQLYSPITETSPTLTLLRLAAGPPLLYGLLLFIHTGMHIPWSSCLSGLTVLLGTILAVTVRHTDQQPYWQKIPPIIAQNRVVLVVIGLLIILIPFILLMMNSLNRLALYRASFP